jgi:hypothetical protein
MTFIDIKLCSDLDGGKRWCIHFQISLSVYQGSGAKAIWICFIYLSLFIDYLEKR